MKYELEVRDLLLNIPTYIMHIKYLFILHTNSTSAVSIDGDLSLVFFVSGNFL
jgi:hypothetical protein